MKNLKAFYKGLTLAAILMIAVTGCKKEIEQTVEDNTKYEAEALTNDADNSYNEVEIVEGDENTEFSAENEGLPEVYTLEEIDMDDAGFKRGVAKRFLVCLKKTNPSDTQVMQLRKALYAFEMCKAADIRMHRAAYAKLKDRVEAARMDLVKQYRAQKITKKEFLTKMADLRKDFVESLRKIKMSYAKTLKACYYKFIREVKGILTDRQWKAFVDCYR